MDEEPLLPEQAMVLAVGGCGHYFEALKRVCVVPADTPHEHGEDSVLRPGQPEWATVAVLRRGKYRVEEHEDGWHVLTQDDGSFS